MFNYISNKICWDFIGDFDVSIEFKLNIYLNKTIITIKVSSPEHLCHFSEKSFRKVFLVPGVRVQDLSVINSLPNLHYLLHQFRTCFQNVSPFFNMIKHLSIFAPHQYSTLQTDIRYKFTNLLWIFY